METNIVKVFGKLLGKQTPQYQSKAGFGNDQELPSEDELNAAVKQASGLIWSGRIEQTGTAAPVNKPQVFNPYGMTYNHERVIAGFYRLRFVGYPFGVGEYNNIIVNATSYNSTNGNAVTAAAYFENGELKIQVTNFKLTPVEEQGLADVMFLTLQIWRNTPI